jgi:hypothetical protein
MLHSIGSWRERERERGGAEKDGEGYEGKCKKGRFWLSEYKMRVL